MTPSLHLKYRKNGGGGGGGGVGAGVGIDKHNISLLLNISIDYWKVSYLYAFLAHLSRQAQKVSL